MLDKEITRLVSKSVEVNKETLLMLVETSTDYVTLQNVVTNPLSDDDIIQKIILSTDEDDIKLKIVYHKNKLSEKTIQMLIDQDNKTIANAIVKKFNPILSEEQKCYIKLKFNI